MRKFPDSISNLVVAFSRLPGVGPKTALRYVYYLLRLPASEIQSMSRSLIELSERIRVCPVCFTYTERTICEICEDPKRDQTVLCIVEESRDIVTIEVTKQFTGRYFVLGGTLNPIEGMTPEVLHVSQLIKRLQEEPQIQEIILALSPTSQGETTILYLMKRLAVFGHRLTRLARGLPLGATLEFADEITLGDAIKERRVL